MTPRKILVVEDEIIVQLHLKQIVTEAGHVVTAMATNADEALKASEAEPPDLVLMDIHLLGEVDGIETARILHERYDCAVIFVTAFADPETIARTEEVGAFGYLVKPFTNATVRAAISTALGGRERLQQAEHRERSLASILESMDEGMPGQARAGDTRMLLYSHDTFGLGHIQRCLNLTRALLARNPGLSILIVTGSPMVHRYKMPKGADYVKLPAVRKVGPERYEARSLAMSGAGIRELRTNLLLRAIRDYDPNVLLVDHSPLGMKGELLPSLEWLARRGGCARILGLRDIIDEPRAVVKDWKEQGVYDALHDLYDHVVVYGSREIYDSASAYEFPKDLAAKTRFMNYVCDTGDPEEADSVERGEEPLVVVSIGGGDGADEVIGTFLDMMQRFRADLGFRAEILTGPFIPLDLEQRFRQQARDLPVTLRNFVSSTKAFFQSADLVVSTGGYNTSTQLLAHAKRAVMIPRALHRQEQRIRALRLDELGLLTCLAPEQVSPARLFNAIRRAMGTSDEPLTRGRSEGVVPLDGAERMADFCRDLLVAQQTAAL